MQIVESIGYICLAPITIMSFNNIYNLFKTLEEESILLSFKGVVTADLVTSILQIIEVKLQDTCESPKTQKKVFNVLVECLQNLYHHADKDIEVNTNGLVAQSSLILVAKINGSYFVRTGNYIEKSVVKNLEHKLKKINSLEKEDLRLYYQQVLSEASMSQKGTAGLGMIDIARKSRNKLRYEFKDINSNLDFFCLEVRID
ncbi:MAG: hypothetical protein ACI9G9_001357 [Psychromonas sp.]|jgi:hypothetical protein